MRVRVGGAIVTLECSSDKRSLVACLLAFTLPLIFLFVFLSSSNETTSGSHDTLHLATPIDQSLLKQPGAREDTDDVKVQRQRRPAAITREPEATGTLRMAMDAAASKRDLILSDHWKLIAEQKRAPDSRYNINVTRSDLIPPDRPVTDTRPKSCFRFKYDLRQLPTVTVIIPYYNEALSMILRTVHSVLNRSPDQLLEEVILVDDKSTDLHLQSAFIDNHLSLLPKVKIIHNSKRVGLVVSRMNGFRASRAPIVIFLDAHTEVNDGWLEPTLSELVRDPNQILQPFVDGIDTMTLEYNAPSVYHKGAFSWDLRYTWIKMADHEQERAIETGLPFPTPTIVGCVIAVNKTFFESIGSFDESLRIWGGENSELSFRAWMCGSKVMTVTCSRIGHAFKNFPYSFDGNKEETVQKNLMRVADAWMDGMRKFFYASTRVYSFKQAVFEKDELDTLDVRKELRKKLSCHNFDWYLYNIIPEVDIPPMNAKYYGEIMNIHTRACWEMTEDYYVGLTYFCYDHKIIPKNNFALTADRLLRYRDKCVRILAPKPYMVIDECPPAGSDQSTLEAFGVWTLENIDVVWGYLKVSRTNVDGVLEYWCIVQVTNAMTEHKDEQMPQLGGCLKDDPFQRWAFTYAFDFTRVPSEFMTYP